MCNKQGYGIYDDDNENNKFSNMFLSIFLYNNKQIYEKQNYAQKNPNCIFLKCKDAEEFNKKKEKYIFDQCNFMCFF